MDKTYKPGIHRGVSTYCWYQELFWDMDIEDMFMHMQDIGAHGLEILADGIIKGYPNPTNDWLDKWFGQVEKYDIVPVEYGHWVESRMYRDRDYTSEEAFEMLVHDIKLASFMGFTCMRTKLGVIDGDLNPVPNWKEFIKMALPYAEKYNVVMQPEVHSPTKLTSRMVMDYCEFIEKEQTKYFGFNIDFGVFQTDPYENPERVGGRARPMDPSKPEDIIPLLPYVHACHAKYYNMDENFNETTIPYEKVINIMKEQGWNGWLLSEYEGPYKKVPGYSTTQVRRHHVMLKRLLGE